MSSVWPTRRSSTQPTRKPHARRVPALAGRAYYMAGNTQAAIDDYRAALRIHVNWGPAVQALQDLGLQP
ncbi:tetratricopeptide repeat protein [Candidatus Villigracilis affinis]|uniref:tetratricopeptide repeat protein n=1 Tax=Candidatus Villigracilis affinis TaxID=3140682 RepID=UPI002A1F4A27|nr:hypothetical protein [Anaerolineales bacterium]